ncbi:hypothetical protein GGR88_001634 [Sphingomonas jejuensis]|uniref:Lipoprotein n=1 Tax=Sphingomonas jejuensis TaxID=904715 RepID=A0ABX0XN86_9SPHN|nr:hypothetical protein [Sphingomonas jejuensis]NJC34160.1 hypothetical protein [Sphingomonas jejuensis]
MRNILLAASAAVALAACASPSTQISTGLQRYGIEPVRAECVGDRLQRNLSLGQLQQLGRAAAAYRRDDPDASRLTVGDLVRVASEINDPEVPVQVGAAAAACGVLP